MTGWTLNWTLGSVQQKFWTLNWTLSSVQEVQVWTLVQNRTSATLDGINNAYASGPGEMEDIMNYEVENSDDEQEVTESESESSELDSDKGSGEDSNEGSDDEGYGLF